MTWRCSSGSVASASVSDACAASVVVGLVLGSSSRTSSHGIARRWRMWSTATLRATRRIQAENGTSRGSYLWSFVISFANTCWVTSSASWSSRTMLRDVAVDVVGVADVEEAERLLVALLGAGDGLGDEAAGVGVVLEAGRAAEVTRSTPAPGVLLGARVLLGAVHEPKVGR